MYKLKPLGTNEAVSTQIRASRRNASAILLTCAALLLAFFLSPINYDFPAILVGLACVMAVQLFCPACRPNMSVPLCPGNIAQLFFLTQLIVIPMVAQFDGFALGTLPWLSSNVAINAGILVNSLAYVSFSLAYQHSSGNAANADSEKRDRLLAHATEYPRVRMSWVVFAYACIGILGFYLYFRSVDLFIEYLMAPANRIALTQSYSGTLTGALSTFLRPFLGFSIALAWSLWIDKSKEHRSPLTLGLVTVIVLVALLVVNLSFNYNRGAVVGPILSMIAVYSLRVRRISLKSLAILSAVALGPLLLWGTYRTTNLSLSDLASPDVLTRMIEVSDPSVNLQVYGGGPQFTGFLLEETGWGLPPYLGKTLISSFLYPVPVLGKAFRLTSAVTLYNMLIYNNPDIIDQVVPFAGELFINFHFIGVIIGYAFLGYALSKLQWAFESARNAFEGYSFFLIAIWTSFLIPGSLAAASQIFIYYFWPIYCYFALHYLSGRRNKRVVSAKHRNR